MQPENPARPGRERGAAAVEMAIVLPVLLLILFGIIDFGRIYNAQVTLTEAAREGARAAALGQSVSASQSRVRSVTGADMADDPGFSIDVRYVNQSGAYVSACATDIDAVVTVSNTVEFVTPFAAFSAMLGTSRGSAWSVSGRGVMACV